MPYASFRDWVDRLDTEGELLRLKEEIKLEPDCGAIGRYVCDTEGPGIYAEKVAGCKIPLTFVLHGSFRRSALAMDMPKTAGIPEQLREWNKRWGRVPASMVSSGPCKEVIDSGEEVNLFDYPIPRFNVNDGGPFINKTSLTTKDPDSDWVNVGMYRMQILDKNKTGAFINAFQHIGMHYKKYEKRGEPMPMAVPLGTEPVLPMVSGMKIPAEWNEYDFAGAIRGTPEALVKCETVDLPTLATAEMVLEGEVKPKLRETEGPETEGPYGETTGCYSGLYKRPVFEIKAITHREDPIYDGLYLGRPRSESHYLSEISKLAGVYNELKPVVPNMTMVAFLPTYLSVWSFRASGPSPARQKQPRSARARSANG